MHIVLYCRPAEKKPEEYLPNPDENQRHEQIFELGRKQPGGTAIEASIQSEFKPGQIYEERKEEDDPNDVNSGSLDENINEYEPFQ